MIKSGFFKKILSLFFASLLILTPLTVLAADTDMDGLEDDDETNIYFTDPNDSDSDDDGLSDGDEVLTYFTDPNDPDSDDDTLTDYDEVFLQATDPNDYDSDDDGLSDGDEVNIYFTGPNNSDTDGDDITDTEEIFTYSTDPNDSDSDDDGLSDGDEVNSYLTDPLSDADLDGDGLPDASEILTYFTNHNDADSDDDGLSDGDEVNSYLTDPNDTDSDDGGRTDGEEVSNDLTDPLDGGDDIQLGGCAGGSDQGTLSGPYYFNDHTYYITNVGTQCDGLASADALGGYLAIINNSTEEDFIYSLTTIAFVDGDDKDVEGTFVFGSAYINWDTVTGQPDDNAGAGEDCVEVYRFGSGRGWNDNDCEASQSSIVEVNSAGSAPTISSLSPADNATGVATNSNLVITFNETVNVGTGNITIKKTSDNTTFATIDVTGGLVTGGGSNTITINPSSDLADSTEYYVLIDATAFDDGNLNSFAGISSTTEWSFTTEAPSDVTNPTVSTLSPADNATGVATNSNLVITFDENVDVETGDITIKRTADDTTFATIDVTGGLVSGSGTDTITINPSSNLAESTGYYIQIDATAFDDTAGNSYAGINDTTTWNFTTADETAPTITNVSSDKTNGYYTVGEVIDIDVTFSEAVTSTGNVAVTLETGDTDRTCTFTVSNSTTGTCNYTVQAGDTSSDLTVSSISGTIADQSANAMSNFVPATNLAANKAIVIDTTAPVVDTFSPLDDATGVSISTNLVITFVEAVDVESGNITIKRTADDTTFATIDVTSGLVTGTGTDTITINPSTDLDESTEYYIQIDATAFDDTAGNSYAGILDTTTWNFTTADATPPTITNVTSDKANGSYTIGEVIDIDVTFNEAVTSTGSVTVTLETGDTDRTCTFTVSNSTTGTCNYTVQSGDTSSDLTVASISGTIADQSANAMSNFVPATNLAANKAIVIDTTAPTVSITAPTEGATVSGASVSITANASDTNLIGVQFKRNTNTNIGAEDTISTYGVTWDTTLLSDGAQSLIAVARDLAGNYATSTVVGVTIDNSAPIVSTLSPTDNAVDVAVGDSLSVTFNEVIYIGTGNILIKKSSDDSIFETIDVTGGLVSLSSLDRISINPSSNLDYATSYYIQIPNTAIVDGVGNSYAGIADTTTWNFTTEDAPAEEDSNPGASGGGGRASSISSSCKPSDRTISVGDKVSFDIDIDTTEDSYTFKWTKVLSGNDEDETHKFTEAGKYYPRAEAKDTDGNITVVNCGTITVEESDDEEEDEEDEPEEVSSEYKIQRCEPYLKEFILVNKSNNTNEVKKLQNFLNKYENENLDESGVYDQNTIAAVKRFQEKEPGVLSFWNLTSATGEVYITTKNAINKKVCQKILSVDCPYFTEKDYSKIGDFGNKVIKIKEFLNVSESEDLDDDSELFDSNLENAVKRFQIKYASKVLTPWNITTPSGWWYQSTTKQANDNLGCFLPQRLDNGVVLE